MSLTTALNIGRTGLAVNQAGLQITGNNIANAGNADYTRQVATITSGRDQELRPGMFLGTGVNLDNVKRQINESLEQRLRGSNSESESADTIQEWLSQVESTFNELSDDDVSTKLSTFFNSWSELANRPHDLGLRQVVVQSGKTLAGSVRDLRSSLQSLVQDADQRLQSAALDADALAQQAADLNAQIVRAEGGTGGVANGLRDQRDNVLKNLAKLIDIQTIADGSSINVYVGSEPLVVMAENRGIGVLRETEDGHQTTSLIFKSNGGTLTASSGQVGGLVSARQRIDAVVDELDTLAHGLIFELNKLHSAGQGLQGVGSVTGLNAVDDTTAVLNSEESGLDFAPANGSFVVHVKNKTTGLTSSTLIGVDLDGLNADDTTLASLSADLDGVANLSSTIDAAGTLKIQTDSSNLEVSFSQDTSGVLAALGINTYFSGNNALDIDVRSGLITNPSLLAAAKNGSAGDNQTALAIAQLEVTGVGSLGGATLKSTYESMVNGVAVEASNARNNAVGARTVRETLETQREALSGVSLDEEALNLMKFQRAYQGAARLISTVNEMMDTLMAITR